MKPHILIVMVALAAALSGCSDSTSCVGDDDCFKGEVCSMDVCVRETDENNLNNASTNNQTAQNNTSNNANNMASGENNRPNNTSTNNTNNTNGTNNTDGVCRGSTFDSCTPDEDASFRTMLSGSFGRGCVMPNDGFEGGEITAEAVMCPLEESDRFSVSVNPCATTSFFLDVEVVPREVCAPGDFDLDVSLSGGGGDCANGNGLIQCSDGEMGAKKASLIVEPSSSVAVLYVDVLPVAENLRFDYDLSVTFRQ